MYASTGLPWDLLYCNTLWKYNDLDFQIPVGRHGDCYDRYLIRIQEMRESIHIIKQCLEQIPEGPCKVENFKIISPPKKYD